MFDRLLITAARHRRVATLAIMGGVVGFAFWEPLFAGATLAPLDLIQDVAHPQRAYRSAGTMADRASGDLVNIHAHWTSFGRIVRDGGGWWDPLVAQGYPIMKGGLPLFFLTYVVFPSWFAAGATAVLRTITAWAFTTGWLRRFELRRSSTLIGGFAYAFSGFMVGWGGWPHASVAAFAPALLWAIERLLDDPSPRRGVPIGLAVAAMIWSNSPLVTAYLLGGVAIYVATRLALSYGRGSVDVIVRRVPATAVAAVVGFGLSYPHLRFFSEWLGWVDTAHRDFSGDTAAGPEFLLTSAFPAAFGSDGHGPAWAAAGNWIEFQLFVGVSVLVVAAFATAAARGSSELARRRRGAITALWSLIVIGVFVGYVGGPVTDVAQTVMGDVSGLATRVKLLVSIGFAGLVAFGFEAWVDPSPDARAARGRVVRRLAFVGAVTGLALVPAALEWFDVVTDAGIAREVAIVSVPHVLAGAVVIAVLVATSRGWLPASGVAVLLAITIVAELLWFARPIPTVFDADEVFEPLVEHELVIDTLEPGERFGGSNQTLWPASTQAFEIPTIGGQTLRGDGMQALLRAIDPIVFEAEAFGLPSYPSIPPSISPALSVWDAMGVGVWGSAPSHAPTGPRVDPEPGFAMDDLAREPRSGTLVVPDGGLRAVVIDALVVSTPGRIEMTIDVGGDTIETWMPAGEVWPGERHALAVPVAGEHLPVGEIATVTIGSTGERGSLLAGVSLDGVLSLGSIAGADDGLEMLSTGAVTLMRRNDAAPFRLHDAAIAEADVDAAARIVVDRPTLEGASVVLDRVVDLPAVADPAADLRIVATELDRSVVTVEVATDRAAVLVLPVPDYPGWTATIDGVDTAVLTADAAFAGVLVPAGSHVVELRFAPDGLGPTLAVFVFTVFLSALVWFEPWRPRRRATTQARPH